MAGAGEPVVPASSAEVLSASLWQTALTAGRGGYGGGLAGEVMAAELWRWIRRRGVKEAAKSRA